MSDRGPLLHLDRRRALVLHRPHPTVEFMLRQLTQIGMAADICWPDLPNDLDATLYGVLFFDADLGHDEQFPWPAGDTPIPAVALIGSEAPGRIAWAIRRGADAQLLKPITSGGIYSAVLIASEAFARRQALRGEVADLKRRLDQREAVAEATALLMLRDHTPPEAAYRALRRQAMAERLSIEAMAARLIEQQSQGSRHDRA
jgi:AmiR/NasT family two-component response regulator